MAYFPDLAPYAFGRGSHPGVVHVGWLDGEHPFSKGSVERSLIDKIKQLAANPVQLYRGKHLCEICVQPDGLEKALTPNRVIDPNCSWIRWAEQRWGNGEIRVRGDDGVVFAAPVLIVHYIEEHHYLPPERFLKAVAAL